MVYHKIGNLPLSSNNPKLLTHVGVTYDTSSPEKELEKAIAAVECGSDIIADVSLGGKWKETLMLLIKNISVPITSLPGYILATQNGDAKLNNDLSHSEILDITEEVLSYGVSGFTIHSAFKKKHIDMIKNSNRVFPFTSRMGNYIKKYINSTGKENPFYECFTDIVKLAKKYDATISLGTALRSPSIVNNGGFDNLFKSEISEMSELVKICNDYNVSVMIEGVGHIQINKMKEWYDFSKEACLNAPLRALPMPTDRALGHDNVAGAIAAAFLANMGVEVICTMTRAEHIAHPTLEDIKESVTNFKIALTCINPDLKAEKKSSFSQKSRRMSCFRGNKKCHRP